MICEFYDCYILYGAQTCSSLCVYCLDKYSESKIRVENISLCCHRCLSILEIKLKSQMFTLSLRSGDLYDVLYMYMKFTLSREKYFTECIYLLAREINFHIRVKDKLWCTLLLHIPHWVLWQYLDIDSHRDLIISANFRNYCWVLKKRYSFFWSVDTMLECINRISDIKTAHNIERFDFCNKYTILPLDVLIGRLSCDKIYINNQSIAIMVSS